MHEFVSFNNEIIPASDTMIPTISSAALYGKGIFTTVAIYDGNPFLWEKHWRRLTNNTAKIGIDLFDYSEGSARNALNEIIEKNDVGNGRARLTFFDESASSIWPFETARKTSLLITTADLRPVPENFRLTTSTYRVNSQSPLAGVKSCNYLENLLAHDEANQRGFDEAIRLNENGRVASGCMANIFWLKNGRIYTPKLATGCLAGTTREFVIENLMCEEVDADLEVINDADAVFLTSAGIGIIVVAERNGKRFGTSEHPITSVLSVARNAAE